jgi:hypothetical protein
MRSFAALPIIWTPEAGAVPSGKLLRNATDLHPEHFLMHLIFALKNSRNSGFLEDKGKP